MIVLKSKFVHRYRLFDDDVSISLCVKYDEACGFNALLKWVKLYESYYQLDALDFISRNLAASKKLIKNLAIALVPTHHDVLRAIDFSRLNRLEAEAFITAVENRARGCLSKGQRPLTRLFAPLNFKRAYLVSLIIGNMSFVNQEKQNSQSPALPLLVREIILDFLPPKAQGKLILATQLDGAPKPPQQPQAPKFHCYTWFLLGMLLGGCVAISPLIISGATLTLGGLLSIIASMLTGGMSLVLWRYTVTHLASACGHISNRKPKGAIDISPDRGDIGVLSSVTNNLPNTHQSYSRANW